MLWWFLILAASTAVVVSVAALLYVQVRRQMKSPSDRKKATRSDLDQPSPPES
jgi:hypothetical protein